MSTSRELQIVTTLKDNASKQLKGLNGVIQKNQASFKKMAMVGTTAFAGVAVGVNSAMQEAAKAEGTWNKFNTVFGEGADNMRGFVEDIREEMPTATHEIARMAADLQDLLIPMGLARDEAQGLTKGALDLANKIAAFNDADPTEVLEAMKSGFVGSSEPLRRFGIDARETALEATALKEGLIEEGQTFRDLEPEILSAVRAQALMVQMTNQSADAISGFEDNQDSFIRRQQELGATFKDIKRTLGEVFLPIVDDLLQKYVLPLIKTFSDWAEKNPEAVEKITAGILVVSGALATIGIAGLALGKVISLLSKIKNLVIFLVSGEAFLTLKGIIGSVIVFGIAKFVLFAIAIGIIIIVAWLLVKNWKTIFPIMKKHWETFWKGVEKWAGWIGENIVDPIAEEFKPLAEKIADKLEPVGTFFYNLIEDIKGWWDNLFGNIDKGMGNVGKKWGSEGHEWTEISREEFESGQKRDRHWTEVQPFAEGGIAKKPVMGMVGENGAEAVIPLKRSGGLGNQIVVNVNAPIYGIGERDVAERLADLIFKNYKSGYKV